MTIVFWNKQYIGAKHAFDTTRKSQDVAELVKATKDQTGIALRAPTDEFIRKSENLIHELLTPEYVRALATGQPEWLASTNGFPWDEGIWDMAVHSTAGVLEATDWALNTGGNYGSLSSGLHHADNRHGSGFCTVNGLAIAAFYAAQQGARRVLIVDYDAHCGGGTHRFLKGLGMEWVDTVDLSTSEFDDYNVDERPNDILIVQRGRDEDKYLTIAKELLGDIEGSYDLVLYNAGVDPHPAVSFDGLARRDQIVFDRLREAQIPSAFVLAGGYTSSYTKEALAQAHMNTILAADGQPVVSKSALTNGLSEVVLLGQD